MKAEQLPSRPAGEDSGELYRELVPLAEAAAVAYHLLVERPPVLRDPDALAETRSLVAIALSCVAPLLRVEGGELVRADAQRLQSELFRHGPERLACDLSAFYVRRLHLLKAVEAMKQAHVVFDRAHVLDALRRLG